MAFEFHISRAARDRYEFDRVLFQCYHYNPASRRYSLYITGFFRVGGALILLIFGGGLAAYWRRELRARRKTSRTPPAGQAGNGGGEARS